MYKAVLISIDGQDYVTDFHNSKSIEDVWDSINDMGSRWYFYPIPLVVKNNKTKTINNRIADIPIDFPVEFKGKAIKTAMQFIKDNPDFITAILS